MDVLDTTLRDGAQSYGHVFSLQDKISIAQELDHLGIKYIEGGWPGSNPKDIEFFHAIKEVSFENSEVVAFGSTRRKDVRADQDRSLNALIEADVDTVVLFGKSWILHVEHIVHTTTQDNLEIIIDSIQYLRDHGLNVIFDCEHFFDGYKDNDEYALKVAQAAVDSGASSTILCDTNGGTLTGEVEVIFSHVRQDVKGSLGIHAHNDLGLGVANTLVAVKNGSTQIQGTINGLGERCGNADLCQILPTLHFKLGIKTLHSDKRQDDLLKNITRISRYVYELANIKAHPRQPYVGENAFAHKGGVHVDAVLKNSNAYEHMDPSLVGNKRELSVSELSGRSAITWEASELGIKLEKDNPTLDRILKRIKGLEAKGHHFEIAKASIHLLILDEMDMLKHPFEMHYWKTIASNDNDSDASGEVIVRIDGQEHHESASGDGPVHALDQAIRRSVIKRFPELKKIKLTNYKVTVIDSGFGTGSTVRVFIEFEDGVSRWATTSVSANIMEASAKALSDGYKYRLMFDDLVKFKLKEKS